MSRRHTVLCIHSKSQHAEPPERSGAQAKRVEKLNTLVAEAVQQGSAAEGGRQRQRQATAAEVSVSQHRQVASIIVQKAAADRRAAMEGKALQPVGQWLHRVG